MYKVSLTKSDKNENNASYLREVTPVHILTEEETIPRPLPEYTPEHITDEPAAPYSLSVAVTENLTVSSVYDYFIDELTHNEKLFKYFFDFDYDNEKIVRDGFDICVFTSHFCKKLSDGYINHTTDKVRAAINLFSALAAENVDTSMLCKAIDDASNHLSEWVFFRSYRDLIKRLLNNGVPTVADFSKAMTVTAKEKNTTYNFKTKDLFQFIWNKTYAVLSKDNRVNKTALVRLYGCCCFDAVELYDEFHLGGGEKRMCAVIENKLISDNGKAKLCRFLPFRFNLMNAFAKILYNEISAAISLCISFLIMVTLLCEAAIDINAFAQHLVSGAGIAKLLGFLGVLSPFACECFGYSDIRFFLYKNKVYEELCTKLFEHKTPNATNAPLLLPADDDVVLLETRSERLISTQLTDSE